MKRTLTLLFLSLFFISFAPGQENARLDSLQGLTTVYSGPKLVDLYIEIAKEQGINNSIQAQQSADEAIKLATKLNYSKGIAKAYLTKGSIYILNNSPMKGLSNFEEAKKIFLQLDDSPNSVEALMGLAQCYSQQGMFDKAANEYDVAISYYETIADYKSLASVYSKAGTNFNMDGNSDLALKYFRKAIEYYQELGDLNNVGMLTNPIGIVYYNLGNYKEAFQAWTDYENWMRQKEDWHRVSVALSNKGLIYNHWAEYNDALMTFTKALELEEKSGNNTNFARIYNSMGITFQNSGNIEKSFEYYRKCVALGEKLDSKQTVSIGLHNIGELHLNLGHPDSALFYVQKSLQIENTLFNKVGVAETKATLGKIYLALNKPQLAFSFFEQAEEVFLETGDKNGLADIYQKYGQAYALQEKDSLTVSYLNKSTKIAEELNLKKMEFENHLFLADYYEKQKDFKKALYHQKLFHQINDSVYNQKAFDRTAYLTIKLEKEAQSKELSDLQHAQDVKSYQSKIKDYIVYFVSLIFIILAISFYWRYIANKRSTIRLNHQYQILLESEEKIKALIDASHDIVFLIDRKGMIVSANTQAEHVLRSGNQLIGYDFKEIIQPYFQNQFDPYITRVLNKKISRGFRLIASTKRTYEITISPVFKQGIEVSGLAIYLQDVTDILAARSEKKKLEEQLFQVQKLESIGTMAGGVAHDFNNYLGTILGYSSMGFDDAKEDTATKRYFSQIMAAAKSAQHTVQKILTFSRKNESKKLGRVNLVEVAEEALSMVESTRPQEVRFDFDYSVESIEILGDAIEIQQVFINLFNNAFQAMEGAKNGHMVCSIRNSLFNASHKSIVRNFKSNNIAGIRVSDDGMGMSEQVLNRVFEPFFTTKDVGSGTGLGLSVVHGIIKNHYGELYVESTLGKGSAFYIYLPAIS